MCQNSGFKVKVEIPIKTTLLFVDGKFKPKAIMTVKVGAGKTFEASKTVHDPAQQDLFPRETEAGSGTVPPSAKRYPAPAQIGTDAKCDGKERKKDERHEMSPETTRNVARKESCVDCDRSGDEPCKDCVSHSNFKARQTSPLPKVDEKATPSKKLVQVYKLKSGATSNENGVFEEDAEGVTRWGQVAGKGCNFEIFAAELEDGMWISASDITIPNGERTGCLSGSNVKSETQDGTVLESLRNIVSYLEGAFNSVSNSKASRALIEKLLAKAKRLHEEYRERVKAKEEPKSKNKAAPKQPEELHICEFKGQTKSLFRIKPWYFKHRFFISVDVEIHAGKGERSGLGSIYGGRPHFEDQSGYESINKAFFAGAAQVIEHLDLLVLKSPESELHKKAGEELRALAEQLQRDVGPADFKPKPPQDAKTAKEEVRSPSVEVVKIGEKGELRINVLGKENACCVQWWTIAASSLLGADMCANPAFTFNCREDALIHAATESSKTFEAALGDPRNKGKSSFIAGLIEECNQIIERARSRKAKAASQEAGFQLQAPEPKEPKSSKKAEAAFQLQGEKVKRGRGRPRKYPRPERRTRRNKRLRKMH